jgi:hypothetical protein
MHFELSLRSFSPSETKRPGGYTHLMALLSIALLIGSPFPALAGPIPSKAISSVSLDSINADRLTAFPAIESETLSERLLAFGYTSDQVRSILDRATPEDRHQLATHLEQLQAAGGARRVWTIVAIVVIVIAILALAVHSAFGHQHLIKGNYQGSLPHIVTMDRDPSDGGACNFASSPMRTNGAQ